VVVPGYDFDSEVNLSAGYSIRPNRSSPLKSMKGKRHTTEQKIHILREADSGKSIVEVSRFEASLLDSERPEACPLTSW